jgi:AsmA protein
VKSLRRWLAGLLVLVVAMVGAAALLPRLVDADTLRTLLILFVRHHTGRELSVDGEVRIALLPRPAIVLPRLALADGPGFGPEPFARLDGARANLRVWPLLRRRLEVASIDIERPQLHLVVDARGRSNWADLLPGGPATGSVAGRRADERLGRIAVRQLTVRGADLLWNDQRSGRWARLHDLGVAVGGLGAGQLVPVQASGVLDVGDPQRSARFDLSGTAERRDDGVWRAPDLRLGAALTGAGLSEPLALRLAADARLDPTRGRLRLRTLALDGAPLQVRGELTAVRAADKPWQIGSQLDIDRLDLRALLQAIGRVPATADPAALADVAGHVELGIDPAGINLARLDLRIDGAHWQGAARLGKPSAPELRFVLQADRIDLDRYLPAAGSGGQAPVRSPANLLRRLASLDVDGTLDVAAFSGRGLVGQQGTLGLRAGGGRIAFKPLRLALYDGTAEAKVAIVAGAGDAQLDVTFTIRDVAAGPLLVATTGRDTLQGRLSVDGDLKGAAVGGTALLRSLRGTLKASVSDGTLKGVGVDRAICIARQGAAAGTDACAAGTDTHWSMLRSGGEVMQGLWRSDDVSVDMVPGETGTAYRLTGTGTFDLPTGVIDYRLRGAESRGRAPVSVRVQGAPGDWSVSAERPAVRAQQSKPQRARSP